MLRRDFLFGLFSTAAIAASSGNAKPLNEKPKILFTGFKPWENVWSGYSGPNITETVLSELKDRLEDLGIEIKILDATYEAVDTFVEEAELDQYDYIVNLGMDPRPHASDVNVEILTSNRLYYIDSNSECPFPISAQDSFKCLQTVPSDHTVEFASPMLLDLIDSPRFSDMQISSIGTPQNYVCAYMFHAITKRIDARKTENIFIHMANTDSNEQAEFVLAYASEILKAHKKRLQNNGQHQYHAWPFITVNQNGRREM